MAAAAAHLPPVKFNQPPHQTERKNDGNEETWDMPDQPEETTDLANE